MNLGWHKTGSRQVFTAQLATFTAVTQGAQALCAAWAWPWCSPSCTCGFGLRNVTVWLLKDRATASQKCSVSQNTRFEWESVN